MSYKYKKWWYKRQYYTKSHYKKYDPQEDFIFWIALLIMFIGFWIMKIYNEQPVFFLGAVIIWIICLWIISWFIFTKAKRKFRKIHTLEQMKNMDWREFEKFITFVFLKKWFKAKTRKGKNDGWIDVDAIKDWQKYAIQCKKWKDYKVGVVEIRSFIGAMEVEWSDLKWIYITTSKLTQEASIYFNKMSHKLELWDADNLESYINEYTERIKENYILEKNHVDLSPLCERCGTEMLLREAYRWKYKWEKFYWCSNYPKCRNITQTTNESF